MTTKAEQFAAKLRYLKGGLNHLEMNTANMVAAECTNILNTLKYFSQILLKYCVKYSVQVERASNVGLLSWPPGSCRGKNKSLTNHKKYDQDNKWSQYVASYPIFDYITLHNTIHALLVYLPRCNERKVICTELLNCLCLTLPFMEDFIRIQVPLHVAELISEYESDLHGLVMDVLCESVIPMSFCDAFLKKDDMCLSSIMPAVLTHVFQFITDSSLHMKLIEACMIFKEELWKDLFTVIAYGSEPVKTCAVQYIFHYWPNLYDHGPTSHILGVDSMPAMISCQNQSCIRSNIVATTMAFDPVIAARYGKKCAPLYLCETCQVLAWSEDYASCFYNIMIPKPLISHSCENRNCLSRDKSASVTLCGMYLCLDSSKNRSSTMLEKSRCRYCSECYSNLVQVFGENQLLIQTSPTSLWDLTSPEDKTIVVDAIVGLFLDSSLSSFSSPSSQSLYSNMNGKFSGVFYDSNLNDSGSISASINSNNHSAFESSCRTCCDHMWNVSSSTHYQFGVWLVTSLCPVKEEVDNECMMSLLTAVMQWCANTTYLPSDSFGEGLENLKLKLTKNWMTGMSNIHFEAVTSLLLPKGKVISDQCETLCPQWQHYANGLSLILCLGSYSIVQEEMWNRVMPSWLTMLHDKYNEIKDSRVLNEVVIKLFDVDLSPFSFDTNHVFKFIFVQFEEPSVESHMQGLIWLQTLTEMQIIVPVLPLVHAFLKGLRKLIPASAVVCISSNSQDEMKDADLLEISGISKNSNTQPVCTMGVLKSCTAMVNILQSQMVLQEISLQTMICNEWFESLFPFLAEMLSWICSHENDDSDQETSRDNKERKSSKLEFSYGIDNVFLAGPNLDYQSEEYLTVWFKRVYDILSFLLPASEKTKAKKEMNDSAELSNIDHKSAVYLTSQFIEVLSKQINATHQHFTLKSLLLVCDNCKVFEYISSNKDVRDPGTDICFQFPVLWTKLILGFHDLFHTATGILLQSLVMNDVSENFIQLMRKYMVADEWTVRFDTINRIEHLADAIDLIHVQKHSPITHAVSSCICLLLSALEDDKIEVQLKAKHIIENISVKSLKNVASCLELEFTAIPQQRSSILLQMQMLSRLRPDAKLFSIFFSACMGYVVERNRFTREQEGMNCCCLQRKHHADISMDRETTHLLVQVVCKYLMEYSGDIKPSSETKCFHSLIRNFFIHFGYNDQIGYFTMKPEEVRETVGFSSFFLSLPKLLDSNIRFGNDFLGKAITLLQFSTFPELQSTNCNFMSHQLTLTLIPKSLQQSWIHSLLLILYKFDITDESQIMQLIIVCLNTLESEVHLCPSEYSLASNCNNCCDHADDESRYGIHAIASLPISPMSPKITSKHRKSSRTSISGSNALSTGIVCDKVDCSSFSSFASHKSSTVRSFAHRMKMEGDTLMSVSSTALSQLLKREHHSISVESLTDVSRNSKRLSPHYQVYSRVTEGSDHDEYLQLIDAPISNQDESIARQTLSEHKGEVSDEDEKQESSIPHSLSSSPYRRNVDMSKEWNETIKTSLEQSVSNFKCHKCEDRVLTFSEETLSSCIINLCYFVTYNSEQVAPILPRILTQLIHISNFLGDGKKHNDANALLTTSTISSSHHAFSTVSKVARQAVRCIMSQLTNNLLLTKLFLLPFNESAFLHGLAACLNDYQYLNSLDAVKHVLEGLPSNLNSLRDVEFDNLIKNLSDYISNIAQESTSSLQWQQIINTFGTFCGKLQNVLPQRSRCTVNGLFNIVVVLLKAQSPTAIKQAFMEVFSKLLASLLQRCSFTVKALYTLCSTSSKIFTKTRDKFFLIRYVVSELISCLKLKNKFSHQNVLMLLQFILVDIGSCLNPCAYQVVSSSAFTVVKMNVLPCYVMDCIKPYFADCADILLDPDFLYNFKEHVYSSQNMLLQGNLCADIKVSIAQIICIELSQTRRQDKSLHMLLPWLYETPTTMQQGPKEYTDCISHIRQLSWLLLGSLTHMGLYYSEISSSYQPIPVELSPRLASFVQVILTGFPSQFMDSLTNVSALFYGFIFCQLWTLYCDELSYLMSTSNSGQQGTVILGWDQSPPSTLVMEFWSRVTPSILLLLKHSNSTSELIHLHVTAVMECLQQYNSAVVFKLYSLWKVMLECGIKEENFENSLPTCSEMRFNTVHSFYASICNKKDFLMTEKGEPTNYRKDSHITKSTSHLNRSAAKLLRIVHQIKERLSQAESRGQASKNFYVV